MLFLRSCLLLSLVVVFFAGLVSLHFGFGFYLAVSSVLLGDRIALVLRGFPGPGSPLLCPLGSAIVFGWSCAGAVRYVAVP